MQLPQKLQAAERKKCEGQLEEQREQGDNAPDSPILEALELRMMNADVLLGGQSHIALELAYPLLAEDSEQCGGETERQSQEPIDVDTQ